MRLLPSALAALTVILAGCSSTPATRFHSLLAGSGTAAAPAPTRYVDLGPVGVPAAVDQPQWVVRLPDDSLRMLEQERWVAPLRDEVRAALLDGLRQRSGVGDARTAPVPPGDVSRVRVDVLRFESAAGRGTWLEARWTVAPGDLSCGISLREPADTDPLALAAAHRRAVNTLADRIGVSLSTRGCPA
jgi:uncharacterized lipoprotein YmbA